MKPGRISRELAGAALGDPRRSRRLVEVAGRMAQSPELSLSAACGGWNESVAAYRLLAAPQVTPEKILAPHRQALQERATAQRLIALYLRRWDIEGYHRVLKTGCRVERLQLKGAGAVRNALTIYAVTAWHALHGL